MVIAMIAMGMMQVPIDQIVNVVPVGYGLMPTAFGVFVSSVMPGALMIGGASIRIHLIY
jgi:hypothetical protein